MSADQTKFCPFCAEDIPVLATVCMHCGRDLIERPSQTQQQSRRTRVLETVIIVVVALFVLSRLGFYTIQPIGAIPEGSTTIVWRDSGEPFFNSADGMCLKRVGEVSIMCRLAALSQAPADRIVLRLPYQEWTYLLSTGGAEFER